MKYERLTERDDRDFIGIIGVDSAGIYKGLDMDESMFITRAIRRLAELEDKIERGELVERTSKEYSVIPCKVGDVVWKICELEGERKTQRTGVIKSIEINADGFVVKGDDEETTLYFAYRSENYNKTWFIGL